MKDLLKTYAPLVALAVGALVYWSYIQIVILRDSVELIREQNVNIVLSATQNCEALYDREGLRTVPKEVPKEESEIEE